MTRVPRRGHGRKNWDAGGALLSVGVAEAGGGDPWLIVGGTAASAAFVLSVALLACIVPARRARRIQPTEALRAEA